jgi:pimeloyl-ACP methyl ester carboxylesterase
LFDGEVSRAWSLLEPLPPFTWAAASDFAEVLGSFGALMEAMVGRYQAGDSVGAYDVLFMPQGLDWRAAAEAAEPGVVDQGIRDAASWFECEALGLAQWSFGPEHAARIDCPLLYWRAHSEEQVPRAARAFLHELFPRLEEVTLDGGDHFSVTPDPAAVAEPIAEFVSQHSVAAALT